MSFPLGKCKLKPPGAVWIVRVYSSLQDVTTGGKWGKCAQDFSVLFLTAACGSISS